MKKILLALVLSSVTLTANANSVITRTLNQTGITNMTTNVWSDHGVKLRNDTDQTQSYHVIFQLCVETIKRCTVWEHTYTLAPHTDGVPKGKEYTEALRIFLPAHFPYRGHYPIRANTIVEGYGAVREDWNADLWVS